MAVAFNCIDWSLCTKNFVVSKYVLYVLWSPKLYGCALCSIIGLTSYLPNIKATSSRMTKFPQLAYNRPCIAPTLH